MASINNTPRPAYVYDTATNEWIPIGVGAHSHNEIPKTVVDAKGDLIVGTAADEVNRLAVGSNGYTLVADSSTSTGLAYGSSALANPVINGAFDIWQRGTSVALAASTSAANGYSADRWQTQTAANQATTISRQATGDTTNLPNIQYCARFQRNSGQTGTGAYGFYNNFETSNSIPFAGKTITLSFYARAGANYSPTSSALAVKLYSGTGTDQNVFGYTGSTTPISQTATLTTTWQRFSYSGTVATSATELCVGFEYSPTGTAGANDYFEVTGVQIDLGSTALPFRRSGGTIQGELAACQRYYYRTTADTSYMGFAMGLNIATNQAYYMVQNPVPMRVAPTSVDFSTLSMSKDEGSVGPAVSSMALTYAGKLTQNILTTGNASTLTQGKQSMLFANNSTSAYLAFNAEL